MQFLILFLGGVALHMANQSSHSITIQAGIISALEKEIISFKTPLLPRENQDIYIYNIILYICYLPSVIPYNYVI